MSQPSLHNIAAGPPARRFGHMLLMSLMSQVADVAVAAAGTHATVVRQNNRDFNSIKGKDGLDKLQYFKCKRIFKGPMTLS